MFSGQAPPPSHAALSGKLVLSSQSVGNADCLGSSIVAIVHKSQSYYLERLGHACVIDLVSSPGVSGSANLHTNVRANLLGCDSTARWQINPHRFQLGRSGRFQEAKAGKLLCHESYYSGVCSLSYSFRFSRNSWPPERLEINH
jgi:hypothetical protein